MRRPPESAAERNQPATDARPELDNDMRLTAAKDRTFKTVPPNQGTASEAVPIPDGRRCELPGLARLTILYRRSLLAERRRSCRPDAARRSATWTADGR
jgi:hypothetical protein